MRYLHPHRAKLIRIAAKLNDLAAKHGTLYMRNRGDCPEKGQRWALVEARIVGWSIKLDLGRGFYPSLVDYVVDRRWHVSL